MDVKLGPCLNLTSLTGTHLKEKHCTEYRVYGPINDGKDWRSRNNHDCTLWESRYSYSHKSHKTMLGWTFIENGQ